MKALHLVIGLAFITASSLTFLGCPESPGKPLPTDLPPQREIPNPDFLSGSAWYNESSQSPFKEVHIDQKNKVVLVVDNGAASPEFTIPGLVNGAYPVNLSLPASGQQIFEGYPESIRSITAYWFTDNPKSPSNAQLAILLPISFLSPNYVVLVGYYIAGLETMDWEVRLPLIDQNQKKVVLQPMSGSPFKDALKFRRR